MYPVSPPQRTISRDSAGVGARETPDPALEVTSEDRGFFCAGWFCFTFGPGEGRGGAKMKRRSKSTVLGSASGVALACPFLAPLRLKTRRRRKLGSVLLPCPGPPTQAFALHPRCSSSLGLKRSDPRSASVAWRPCRPATCDIFFDQPSARQIRTQTWTRTSPICPTYITSIEDDF